MSWKTDMQIIDLPSSQRLEVTCRQCEHSRYEQPALLITKLGLAFEYLDEVERMLYCARCSGPVRIALSSKDDTEGFVGGLA